MMAVVVETKELAQTVVASVVAGVGITVVFSIAMNICVRTRPCSHWQH